MRKTINDLEVRNPTIPFQFLSILLLFFNWGAITYAQEAPGEEKVSFHTPKTLYFSSEKIWFQAQVNLGEIPSPSQVLYAELVDRNSNSIAHVKVPLQEGKALNFIPLSDQIPSDQYLVRVYTRISPYLNFKQGIAQQFVTIINPKIPPQETETSKRNLKFVSKSYSKGERVDFTSSRTPSSVVASGIAIANPFLEEEHRQWLAEEVYEPLPSKGIFPELFGHLVQAKVSNLDTTLTYFLSLHGGKSALFTDHVDESGTLIFDAGGLRHWERLIVQLENGDEIPGLELVSPLITTQFRTGFIFPELYLAEEDLPMLQPLLKAAVVQANYLEDASQDPFEVVTGFVADYTFNLDDYTRFESVETILKEYVPSVSVRMKDKKKTFRLLNEADKNVFDENPLILVDAMPVFDSDLLASFNPKFLQSLEVLNREFYLNDRIYPGVLSFSSYSNNFGLFPLAPAARFFDYLGLQPAVRLDVRQFEKPSSSLRIPDWRTILFWGANVEKVSTQLPDLKGHFVFWEQQKLNGEVVLVRTYFEVK